MLYLVVIRRKKLYEWQQTKDGKSAIDKSCKDSSSAATTKKSYKAQIKALKGKLKALKEEKKATTEEIAVAISTAFASIPVTKANVSSALVRIQTPATSAADTTTVPAESNTTYSTQATAAAVAIKGILKWKRDNKSTE